MVELSVDRRRRCRLFGVEVVQFEADLLARLGTYSPRLSTVTTRRCVWEYHTGQVAGCDIVERWWRYACPALFARHRCHCGTTATPACLQRRRLTPSLKRSAQVQYNYNTTAIQEFFYCIAVVLHLCGLLQCNNFLCYVIVHCVPKTTLMLHTIDSTHINRFR